MPTTTSWCWSNYPLRKSLSGWGAFLQTEPGGRLRGERRPRAVLPDGQYCQVLSRQQGGTSGPQTLELSVRGAGQAVTDADRLRTVFQVEKEDVGRTPHKTGTNHRDCLLHGTIDIRGQVRLTLRHMVVGDHPVHAGDGRAASRGHQ